MILLTLLLLYIIIIIIMMSKEVIRKIINYNIRKLIFKLVKLLVLYFFIMKNINIINNSKIIIVINIISIINHINVLYINIMIIYVCCYYQIY